MKSIQSYVKRIEKCLKIVLRTLNASKLQRTLENVRRKRSTMNAYLCELICLDASDI